MHLTFGNAPCRALCLALAALPGAGAAQTLMGEVRTDTGLPLQGYPVVVEGMGQRQVAVTDEKGVFSLQGLASGSYNAMPSSDLSSGLGFDIKAATTPSAPSLWQKITGSGPSPAQMAPVDIGTIVVPTMK